VAEPKETVVREFAPVGRYRVRLLDDPKRGRSLDVREFVDNQTFSGFTRRGCRFTDRAQLGLLRDILSEAIASFPDGKPAKS
jgi:hypothetical protein